MLKVYRGHVLSDAYILGKGPWNFVLGSFLQDNMFFFFACFLIAKRNSEHDNGFVSLGHKRRQFYTSGIFQDKL